MTFDEQVIEKLREARRSATKTYSLLNDLLMQLATIRSDSLTERDYKIMDHLESLYKSTETYIEDIEETYTELFKSR